MIPSTIKRRESTCETVVKTGDLTTPVIEFAISTTAQHWMTVRIMLVLSKKWGWPNSTLKKIVLKKTIDHNEAEIELYAISHLFGWAEGVVESAIFFFFGFIELRDRFSESRYANFTHAPRRLGGEETLCTTCRTNVAAQNKIWPPAGIFFLKKKKINKRVNVSESHGVFVLFLMV